MGFFDALKTSLEIVGNGISRKAPEICVGLGIVAGVAAVVVAAKETVKAQEILDEFKEDKEAIEICKATKTEEEYPEDVYKHDILVTYSKAGVGLAKTYALAFGLELGSIIFVLVGLGILRSRNAKLVVAYNALLGAFNKYRQRVIEDKGNDADVFYMTGAKPESTKVEGENGEKIEAKVIKDKPDPATMYLIKFSKYKENGERNLQWTSDRYYDLQYIKGQIDCLDDLLYNRTVWTKDHEVKMPGWVTHNEMRDRLGEDYNSTGQIVGNMYHPEGENGCNGCIKVDVIEGVEEDPDNPGKEIPYFLINPNVDGMIYDQLDAWKKPRHQRSRLSVAPA